MIHGGWAGTAPCCSCLQLAGLGPAVQQLEMRHARASGGPALAAVRVQACSLHSCRGWCLSRTTLPPPAVSTLSVTSTVFLPLCAVPPFRAAPIRLAFAATAARTCSRRPCKESTGLIAPNLHCCAAASPLPVHSACRCWVCCTRYMVGCMQPARSSGSVSCGAKVGRGCRGADPSCARPGRTGRAVRGTEHVWKRQRESRERGARTGYCDCGGRNVPLRRPSAGQPSPMRAAAAVGRPGKPPA